MAMGKLTKYVKKAAPLKSKVKKLIKKVNRLEKLPEIKQVRGTTTLTPTTTMQALATGVTLGQIVQGDDGSSRDGDAIEMRSFHVCGTLTTQEPMFVVLALVLDKQCGGAVLDPSQVFFGTIDGIANNVRNNDFIDRYQILSYKKVYLNPIGDAGGVVNAQYTGFYSLKTRKRIKVRYLGNTGAITSLSGANIQLVYWCNQNSTGSSGPINMLMEFTDV